MRVRVARVLFENSFNQMVPLRATMRDRVAVRVPAEGSCDVHIKATIRVRVPLRVPLSIPIRG